MSKQRLLDSKWLAVLLATLGALGALLAAVAIKLKFAREVQLARTLHRTTHALHTTTHASGADLDWRGKAVLPELDASLYMFGMAVMENATRVGGPYSTILHQSLEFQGFLEDSAVGESRRARTLEERFPVGDGTLDHMNPEYIEAVTSSSWWQLRNGTCTVTLANGRVSRGYLRLKYPVPTFGRPYQRYNTQVLTFECMMHVRQYLCNGTNSIRIDEARLDWPVARERAILTNLQVPCVTVQHQKDRTSKNTVAMCLPPLSKDYSPRRLVEFMAYHRSLGVTSFHFFSRYARTSQLVRSIFDQAPHLGPYTVTNSSFSEHGAPELFERYWYYEHLLWLNFCARHLARNATWVTNLEMDEYLVAPAATPNNRTWSVGDVYEELARSTGKDIFLLLGPHVACDGSEKFLTQCAYVRNLTGKPGAQPMRPKSVFRPQTFEYAEFHVVHPERNRKTFPHVPALIHYFDGSSQRSTPEQLLGSKERFHTLTSYTAHHVMVDAVKV